MNVMHNNQEEQHTNLAIFSQHWDGFIWLRFDGVSFHEFFGPVIHRVLLATSQ